MAASYVKVGQEIFTSIRSHRERSPTLFSKKFRLTKLTPQTTLMNKSITVIPQIHEITNKMYTGQTGKFPHKSSKGNQYVMVVYVYEANIILAEPLKNKTGA